VGLGVVADRRSCSIGLGAADGYLRPAEAARIHVAARIGVG
jgi:hypothetical protein